ncbi:MAG: type 4a pilus biogenesis protein PilO [Nitrospirae bacterium]|nr:type 4a pilus biogenesis protein PilO [Nitrospirota bacterium]MBI5695033.1 type 4a pilus biogenesis protein PilO [Nitrospirota bacterium]
MGRLVETVKNNRKMQALILLLVAIVVADAGFYLLRVKPASGMAVSLAERAGELEKELASKEAEYERYAAYKKRMDDVERFKQVLPRRSEFTQVIDQVYHLAKDNRMSGASFGADTRGLKQEGDLAQLSFSMPIRGKYSDVRRFIYDVETSDLFLNIHSLGLSKVEEPDQISLTIGLSTYVRL